MESLFGKQELCYTDLDDFTGHCGVGSDPMYKRYDNIFAIVKNAIDEKYWGFLAQPIYEDATARIHWFAQEWNEAPVRLSSLPEGPERDHAFALYNQYLNEFKQGVNKLEGGDISTYANIIRTLNPDFAYIYDGKISVVAWGMKPDPTNHKAVGTIVHELNFSQSFKITLDAGAHGHFKEPLDNAIVRKKGHVLSSGDFPSLNTDEGWNHVGWSPDPIGVVVSSEMSFQAMFVKAEAPYIPPVEPTPPPASEPKDPELYECKFVSGSEGTIVGPSLLLKPAGDKIHSNEVPDIKPAANYRFVGWDEDPKEYTVSGNKTFHAVFEKDKEPWYKRFWLWLTGLFSGLSMKGCLSKLLRILIFLLLMFLLMWLLKSCLRSCGENTGHGSIAPLPRTESPDGSQRDDNGSSRDIRDSEGKLPNENITSPITDEDGNRPPIKDNPSAPSVIANRLNIYFEDDNADMDDWVSQFKSLYPSDDYKVIGRDNNAEMIQIQIPEEERDNVREELPQKITSPKFFVVDESIFSIVGGNYLSDPSISGWHLEATHVKEAWNITKGSSNVIVAVVDDGIDGSHEAFGGRFYKPYNVFTQDNRLSAGSGHGTHVASLAVGSDKTYDKGAAGVAPGCMLMPVQVFDNDMCTFSSVTNGIMYAIHQGADIINVSIAPSFKGLSDFPIDFQGDIANKYFKNEQRVWEKIVRSATKKNVILVFAAGNDNILAYVYPENRVKYSICVTAVNKDYKSTEFTNYLYGSDISAPGQAIYAAMPDNKYEQQSGTSMSAPIICGAIALMRSIKPDITVLQALHVMQKTGHATDDKVPPMVLIDYALQAVKDGKYMDDNENQEYFPGGDQIGQQPSNPNGSESPDNGTDSNNSSNGTIQPINNPNDNTDNQSEDDGYAAIRKEIERLRRQIERLEGQLPENRR